MVKMNSRAQQIILIAVMMIMAVASRGVAAEKYQWKSAGIDGGCSIYTSSVAGKEYIAAKAVCVIPARMDVVGVILRDIGGYPEWMSNCSETRMLKVVDDVNDVLIFWYRQRIPVFTDRDMVLKSKSVCRTEKRQCFVYADLTRELSYDSGKGYLKMLSFSSLFVLDWIDEQHTQVTFIIDPDFGRGIPVAAANRSIKETPSLCLKKMAEMTKRQKYLDAAKTSRYARLLEDYIRSGIR